MSKKIGIEMEKLPFFLSLFLLFRILLLFLQCIPLAMGDYFSLYVRRCLFTTRYNHLKM